MLRVGIAGALGRLGRVACAAVAAAGEQAIDQRSGEAYQITLAATLSRGEDVGAFLASGLDVVVDCTVYPASRDITFAAVAAGLPIVVGVTGWPLSDVRDLEARARDGGVPVLMAPNFSFGAALMMRFAAQAARVFRRAEIIELHHEDKRDAPSGTAKLTAERIAVTGAPLPAIHSIRLPGLVAHQEVIFGGDGETLTIRHDSLSRDSFGPGIVAAVRAVRSLRGLTFGMDAILDQVLGDACASP